MRVTRPTKLVVIQTVLLRAALHARMPYSPSSGYLQVLLTHVVEGQYRSGNVQEDTPIDSLSGTMLEYYKDPFGVSVVGGERANATTQDIETCAGPVHVIDAVRISRVRLIACFALWCVAREACWRYACLRQEGCSVQFCLDPAG